MTGGAEGLKIGRIRIRSHINLNFILQQSLTAFGGAPFTQGSLSRYHAFGLLDNPGFNAPSTDAHQALGSPSGRAGAKRLRGLTAPILPTSYPQIHCTDSLYETAFLHELSAHPSPPPFGRYLSRRERQGLCANLKRNDKPGFIAPTKSLAQAKAPLCKGSCQRS